MSASSTGKRSFVACSRNNETLSTRVYGVPRWSTRSKGIVVQLCAHAQCCRRCGHLHSEIVVINPVAFGTCATKRKLSGRREGGGIASSTTTSRTTPSTVGRYTKVEAVLRRTDSASHRFALSKPSPPDARRLQTGDRARP